MPSLRQPAGLLAILIFSFLAAPAFAQDAAKPNIVFILADDLGYGDLGCYGHPRIKTPNLDALAKQGARLTQCYSASAVCSPSRSAILTGRTPHRNGVYTWIAANAEVHLRTSEITLPKLLKSVGYDTCHVGKWHLNGKFNSPDQPQPGDHGYDHWLATQNNAGPSHKDPNNFVRNGKEVGQMTGFSAPLIADEAIDWLTTKRDKTKPFLLSMWAHEPHLPIESDPQFMKLYEDLPPDFQQHHGNVTQLDFAVGKVLKALEEQKLAGNTIVVFTADNGPEGNGQTGRTRGSPGELRGRKRSMYEGGIRVAGIVRWPGKVPAASTVDMPVNGTDWFTTLVVAAGVKPPADRVLDGVDIMPVLTGKATTVARSEPLYWRLNMSPPKENLHMVLRDGDWKILASEDFTNLELYNLKADPSEKTDLKEKEPQKFAEMRKALEAHNAEIEKEGPDWWKRLSASGGGAKKKAP